MRVCSESDTEQGWDIFFRSLFKVGFELCGLQKGFPWEFSCPKFLEILRVGLNLGLVTVPRAAAAAGASAVLLPPSSSSSIPGASQSWFPLENSSWDPITPAQSARLFPACSSPRAAGERKHVGEIKLGDENLAAPSQLFWGARTSLKISFRPGKTSYFEEFHVVGAA